jgi:arsenate reductase
MKKVLFLCTGNSCRSQMAEAIVNARLADTWQASSAGSRPTGFVHPKTIQVLAEIGIQHKGRSKSIDEFQGQDFNLVMTVCDPAAEECPVWLGKGTRMHNNFPDPAKSGKLKDFRQVRDAMERLIIPILEKYPEAESPPKEKQ